MDLGSSDMDEQHAILLGEGLKAGAFPRLKKLRIGGQRVYRSVWDALEAGSCPGLREIGLANAHFGSDSVTALVSDMVSVIEQPTACCTGTPWDDGGGGNSDANIAAVLGAMAISCHDLRRLSVSIRSTDEEASKALWSALRGGKWPKLQSFSIWSFSDDTLRELAVLLEKGVGFNLKALYIDGSIAGVVEVGQVLREGACPKLRTWTASVWWMSMNKEEQKGCRDDLSTSLKGRGIKFICL